MILRLLFGIIILAILSKHVVYSQNANYQYYSLGVDWQKQEPYSKLNYGGLKTPPEINWKNFIAPSICVTYGALALTWKPLIDFNERVKNSIAFRHPSRPFRIDDYLQYGPAAMVLIFQIAGMRGNNIALQETTIYAASLAIQGIVITSIKTVSNELRPDGSSRNSFPSGHTTTAFASAELLRLEYGSKSPWIPVVGYLMAGTTGFLRMYNNRHWFNDVVAGIGFGIASTDLSYLINIILPKSWTTFHQS